MSKTAKTARILYLEDDREWQEKIQDYLGTQHDLVIVGSQGEAEAMVFPPRSDRGKIRDGLSFDLFIADISLVLGDSGDEQGLRFVEEIRNKEGIYQKAGETIPEMKIMILTAYPWRERIKRAFRDLGVVDFLDKGHVSRIEVVEAVDKALSG